MIIVSGQSHTVTVFNKPGSTPMKKTSVIITRQSESRQGKLTGNSLTDNDTVKDLYCSCTNTQACGAAFVFTLSFKHVLNPPAKTTSEIALNLVNLMSKEEKEALQQRLF